MTTLLNFILAERSRGAKTWLLKAFGTASQAVFPLFLIRDDFAQPVGTSFLISRFGHVLTAHHNLEEALRQHPAGLNLLNRYMLPESVDLREFGDTSFSLLHCVLAEETLSVSFCPLSGATGARNLDDERQRMLDISLATIGELPIGKPILPLKISFEVPRVGSAVYAIGYSRVEIPNGRIGLSDLRDRRIPDWRQACQTDLTVVEAKVTHIFTQGFANGFLQGACFAFDAEIPHGISGGPVLDERGRVCGVASAGASQFFGEPRSLASMLYPILPLRTTLRLKSAGLEINSEQDLLSLVAMQAIDADGTEAMVRLVKEGQDLRVGPLIHEGDAAFVFDNFEGLQASKPAELEERPTLKVVRRAPNAFS